MFRLQCYVIAGGLIVTLAIPSPVKAMPVMPDHLLLYCYADTLKYGDNESKEKVIKYTDSLIGLENGKAVPNPDYNKAFAHIIQRLDAAVDVFYLMHAFDGYHGDFFYDGTVLRMVIRDPGQVYGTKNGTDALLFEEVKHAEQFLDGKTFFEKRNARWVCIGNLQLEVEAKLFVANTLPIRQSWEYTDTTTDKTYVLPSILWSIKQARSEKERLAYLKNGIKIPFGTDINNRGFITIGATYPEGQTTAINNSCPKRTKNDALFCYPKKMAFGH
jgi:hypothetical protein